MSVSVSPVLSDCVVFLIIYIEVEETARFLLYRARYIQNAIVMAEYSRATLIR